MSSLVICFHATCKEYAVKDGRCSAHPQPHRWRRYHSLKSMENRPSDWGLRVKKVLSSNIRNNGGLCVLCNESEATDVDHIKPVNEGGDHSFSNLRALCSECHKKKTALEGVEALKLQRKQFR